MENLVYVTGNHGKYVNIKEHFENRGIKIDYYKCDIEELDINDIKLVSQDKAKKAYAKLKRPCFVGDSGFYIEDYPGCPNYPGAFVKRSGISTDIEKLLNTMEGIENRNCRFIDCLTFYDGLEYFSFIGVNSGTLSLTIKGDNEKKAKSNLWRVFIPKNCTKVLAEMSEDEFKNRKDERTSATEQFIDWYLNTYKNMPKIKQKELLIKK